MKLNYFVKLSTKPAQKQAIFDAFISNFHYLKLTKMSKGHWLIRYNTNEACQSGRPDIVYRF